MPQPPAVDNALVSQAALRGGAVSSRMRRGLHYLGAALAFVGIAFVVRRLHAQGIAVDLTHLGLHTYALTGGLVLACGAGNLMLGVAWWHLLAGLGTAASPAWAVRTHAVSQLARYVPGNVAHLVSRQVIGMARGVSGWTLAKSSTLEIGLISVAGLVLGLLALPLRLPGISPLLAGLASVGSVLAVTVLLARAVNRNFAAAFLWQAAFLGVTGAAFALLLTTVAPTAHPTLPWICAAGAYIAAWLVGLVTPGAPAGLGVRELVLLTLMPIGDGSGNVLLAIALMRLVTLVGDLLVFLAASSVRAEKMA